MGVHSFYELRAWRSTRTFKLAIDDSRVEHQKMAQTALADITTLVEYLQSPKAADNAKRIRAKRQSRRKRNGDAGT